MTRRRIEMRVNTIKIIDEIITPPRIRRSSRRDYRQIHLNTSTSFLSLCSKCIGCDNPTSFNKNSTFLNSKGRLLDDIVNRSTDFFNEATSADRSFGNMSLPRNFREITSPTDSKEINFPVKAMLEKSRRNSSLLEVRTTNNARPLSRKLQSAEKAKQSADFHKFQKSIKSPRATFNQTKIKHSPTVSVKRRSSRLLEKSKMNESSQSNLLDVTSKTNKKITKHLNTNGTLPWNLRSRTRNKSSTSIPEIKIKDVNKKPCAVKLMDLNIDLHKGSRNKRKIDVRQEKHSSNKNKKRLIENNNVLAKYTASDSVIPLKDLKVILTKKCLRETINSNLSGAKSSIEKPVSENQGLLKVSNSTEEIVKPNVRKRVSRAARKRELIMYLNQQSYGDDDDFMKRTPCQRKDLKEKILSLPLEEVKLDDKNSSEDKVGNTPKTSFTLPTPNTTRRTLSRKHTTIKNLDIPIKNLADSFNVKFSRKPRNKLKKTKSAKTSKQLKLSNWKSSLQKLCNKQEKKSKIVKDSDWDEENADEEENDDDVFGKMI